jgi:fumarate hydratase class II
MSTLGRKFAVPTTLGQNFAGYTHQIARNIERLKTCESSLYQLPMDYSAGTKGIDVPEGFTKDVTQCLTELTTIPFARVTNILNELHTYNAMVASLVDDYG